MSYVLVVVALLTVALPAGVMGGSTPTATTNESLHATVVSVTDGDTVDVEYSNDTTDTVRLLGVDTP